MKDPDDVPESGPLQDDFLLAQSQAEFKAIFETSRDLIWTVDAERFSFMTCNPAFRKHFGERYGVALRPGMLSRDYLAQQQADLWVELYRRTLYEERVQTEYESPDRANVWRASLSALRGDDGRTFGIAVVCQNVTEQRSMEAALRESNERFFQAFEHAAIGKALVLPEGRLLKVNRSICELFGYSAEELTTFAWQQITHPDDIELDQQNVDRLLRGEVDHYEIEKRYIHKSGAILWTQLSVSLVRTAEGLPLYFVSQVQDISERRQAEEALRRSEAEIRSFVEHAPVGIVRSSITEDRLLRVNPAFVSMMGYQSTDEVLSLRLSTDVYLNPGDRPGIVAQLRETRQFRGVELAVRRKDGSPVVLRLSGRMREEDSGGSSDIFDMIVEDVTQHRNLEGQLRQSQKMEAIGLLAGGISHDFNNLLSIIMGNVALLLDDTAPDTPMRAHGDAILEATRRAADLIRQLLTFSRKQVLDPMPLDLNAVITDTGRLLHRLVGKEMRMVFDLTPGIGCIHADRGQIEQVLLNLATNARDAMPGGGEFTLHTEDIELGRKELMNYPYIKPGKYVLLRATDTGEGMSIDVQSHIFEPFFTTKPTGKGTGLGLATIYGIVKQNGGYIWVSSKPGHGATFDICLPRLSDNVENRSTQRAGNT